MHRTQHRVDRFVAIKPAAERTEVEPIARPTLLSKILTWKNRNYRSWGGVSWFDSWSIQSYVNTIIEHENKGLHPTLHDAERCGSYKALISSARRLRDFLNSLDLGD
jgi:hypothetical protein